MRLLPGRKIGACLRPMDQRGLITPVEQPSHRRSVRFRVHERLHRRVGRPDGVRPERVPAISQQPDRKIAIGSGRLPGASKRLNEERWEIEP